MRYEVFEDEPYYICHDGRELRHIRTETKEQNGYTQTLEVYGCADCSGCEHKARCLYKYNAQTNPEGILNRQIRSTRRKGTWGISRKTKNSDVFTIVPQKKYIRSLCCTQSVGISINTTAFCMKNSKNTKGKRKKKQLRQKRGAKNPGKGFVRPKIEYMEKRSPSCFDSRH